jgi:hypothetical protein
LPKPKRHHFVPRAYLGRFGSDGRVLVRWRGKAGLLAVGIQNVAVECGFYGTEGPRGERSVAVEEALAGVEGAAAGAIQLIDKTGAPPDAGSSERTMLAAFMALQLTRTPEQRGRVLFARDLAVYAGEREINAVVVAEYLERIHLGFRPSDSEVSAALDFARVALQDPAVLTNETAIQLMVQSAERLVPVLLDRCWTLEIARKPRLLTSDHPLVIWRKPSPRDQYEGVGIANAEELRFPLDPGKQLVLTPTARPAVRLIEPNRVKACNVDIASGCHRFIVGCPSWPRQLQEVPLAERRPVVRFNTGPLYEKQPDGTTLYRGEVIHAWVPRR